MRFPERCKRCGTLVQRAGLWHRVFVDLATGAPHVCAKWPHLERAVIETAEIRALPGEEFFKRSMNDLERVSGKI